MLRFYQWAHVPDWEKVDAENLERFMQSAAGKKLALRLRNASLRHNASAVQDTNIHRCGIAAGYMLCLSDLSALAIYGESEPKSDTLQTEDLDQEGET
ncbi:MAG TPA: hypothetical protein VFH87_03695, partial [Candidatus Udaeobacter sp.]|nr:hypothetical protein [Candidatus Udaeobacter sp.]